MLFFCSFFFFSSRRRHTRWPRDWSSDVCSSDLLTVPLAELRAAITADVLYSRFHHSLPSLWIRPWYQPRRWRSEERRVGKECRPGWCAWHYRKKTQRRKKICVMTVQIQETPTTV